MILWYYVNIPFDRQNKGDLFRRSKVDSVFYNLWYRARVDITIHKKVDYEKISHWESRRESGNYRIFQINTISDKINETKQPSENANRISKQVTEEVV